jgi:hypothetical protein
MSMLMIVGLQLHGRHDNTYIFRFDSIQDLRHFRSHVSHCLPKPLNIPEHD